jgi:hypothetical protein
MAIDDDWPFETNDLPTRFIDFTHKSKGKAIRENQPQLSRV